MSIQRLNREYKRRYKSVSEIKTDRDINPTEVLLRFYHLTKCYRTTTPYVAKLDYIGSNSMLKKAHQELNIFCQAAKQLRIAETK